MIALLRLGGRGEDGLGQAGSLGESLWQLNAAYAAGCLVLLESRTGEITAGDALERKHVELLHDHCAAKDFLGDALVIERSGQVVGEVDGVEEELRRRREHAALVGDSRLEGVVIGGNAVGDHHEQGVVIDFVDIAHLAGGDVGIGRKFWTHDIHSRPV